MAVRKVLLVSLSYKHSQKIAGLLSEISGQGFFDLENCLKRLLVAKEVLLSNKKIPLEVEAQAIKMALSSEVQILCVPLDVFLAHNEKFNSCLRFYLHLPPEKLFDASEHSFVDKIAFNQRDSFLTKTCQKITKSDNCQYTISQILKKVETLQ